MKKITNTAKHLIKDQACQRIICLLMLGLLFGIWKCYQQEYGVDKKVFSEIYTSAAWGLGSGSGSYAKNTGPYREFLENFILSHPDIHSVVDFGCGDWQIMSLVKLPENLNYTGVDVVPHIIHRNQQYLKKNIHFKLIKNEHETPKADLIIVKDVLQHWPNEKINYFYEHIIKKYKYALIINSYGLNENKDIKLGWYRPLDLTKKPFYKKELNLLLQYDIGGEQKKVYLYKK
ncbi:MAG: hypothetical protein JWM09_120 [Francisellaceae bacterium]|nr:hypothetical protein [Francisellaceae bacterium]